MSNVTDCGVQNTAECFVGIVSTSFSDTQTKKGVIISKYFWKSNLFHWEDEEIPVRFQTPLTYEQLTFRAESLELQLHENRKFESASS